MGWTLRKIILDFEKTLHAKRIANSWDNQAKPFLQWVWWKRSVIPQYEQYIPKKYNKYYEPFLWWWAMFFYLHPENAILWDNNLELIKTYEWVRDNVHEVIELLKLLKEIHSKELYMKIRNLDRELNIFDDLENYEISARMIYLNQTWFNWVYRVNKLGQYNVPIWSSLNRLICDEENLLKVSKVLKSAKVECNDFMEIIKTAKNWDFVYLDPPYHPVSKYSDFTRYTKEKFYEKDQIRLKEIIDELTEKWVMVMLSNSYCEFIDELYSKYRKIDISANRLLNSKKEKRNQVPELLILNY